MTLTPADDDSINNDGVGEEISDLASVADRLDPLRGLTRFSVDDVSGTLAAVSSILRAPDLIAEVNALYALERGIASGTIVLQDVPVEAGAAYTRTLECPGGGRYYATLDDSETWKGSFTFEFCVMGAVFRNGSYAVETVSATTDSGEPIHVASVALNALGVSKLGEWVRAMQGSIVQQHVVRPDATVVNTILQSVQHNEVVLVPDTVPPTVLGLLALTQPDSVIESAVEYMVPALTFSQTAFTDGSANRWLRLSEESSILTTEPDLSIVISQPANELVLQGDTLVGGYDSGVLELTVSGAEGNRLKLQADNGDEATFDVTIGGALESVVSTVVSWSSFSPELFQAPDRLQVLDDLLQK